MLSSLSQQVPHNKDTGGECRRHVARPGCRGFQRTNLRGVSWLGSFCPGKKSGEQRVFRMAEWCHAAGALRKVYDFVHEVPFFSHDSLATDNTWLAGSFLAPGMSKGR